ncbi:unnamed protein product [Cylicocyclus nassatus]|uniref:Uncharacterized protein n=1 Tax=Cylicocyclus nassatus TaxID=53992 RepID=A0AA36GNJ6_CYLNA|nr:unnamed protein product [Cylicocyclus nassatus]
MWHSFVTAFLREVVTQAMVGNLLWRQCASLNALFLLILTASAQGDQDATPAHKLSITVKQDWGIIASVELVWDVKPPTTSKQLFVVKVINLQKEVPKLWAENEDTHEVIFESEPLSTTSKFVPVYNGRRHNFTVCMVGENKALHSCETKTQGVLPRNINIRVDKIIEEFKDDIGIYTIYWTLDTYEEKATKDFDYELSIRAEDHSYEFIVEKDREARLYPTPNAIFAITICRLYVGVKYPCKTVYTKPYFWKRPLVKDVRLDFQLESDERIKVNVNYAHELVDSICQIGFWKGHKFPLGKKIDWEHTTERTIQHDVVQNGKYFLTIGCSPKKLVPYFHPWIFFHAPTLVRRYKDSARNHSYLVPFNVSVANVNVHFEKIGKHSKDFNMLMLRWFHELKNGYPLPENFVKSVTLEEYYMPLHVETYAKTLLENSTRARGSIYVIDHCRTLLLNHSFYALTTVYEDNTTSFVTTEESDCEANQKVPKPKILLLQFAPFKVIVNVQMSLHQWYEDEEAGCAVRKLPHH